MNWRSCRGAGLSRALIICFAYDRLGLSSPLHAADSRKLAGGEAAAPLLFSLKVLLVAEATVGILFIQCVWIAIIARLW